jgi:hypothetical protein
VATGGERLAIAGRFWPILAASKATFVLSDKFSVTYIELCGLAHPVCRTWQFRRYRPGGGLTDYRNAAGDHTDWPGGDKRNLRGGDVGTPNPSSAMIRPFAALGAGVWV